MEGDAAYVIVLRSCAVKADLCAGVRVHAEIVRKGLLQRSPYVASSLISMYAKCGELVQARKVLEELPVRNVVSWNALIAGYSQHGRCDEALKCFEYMQIEGVFPNVVTFISAIKACGSSAELNGGMEIHDAIRNRGLVGKDIVLDTALVDMYAKCGELEKAREILDELPMRNVISWTAMIASYAQQGQGLAALDCYERMLKEGISPNAVTLVSVLNACGSAGAIDVGRQIHEEITNEGLMEKGNNMVLGNALVNMYAKCGMVSKAQQVLESLHGRSVVSWSALIAGYVQQEQGMEAWICFERMQNESSLPDAITFISILKACGICRAIHKKGRQIHSNIYSTGLLEKDMMVGTALVDMYAKCQVPEIAQEVLGGLPVRDVISWNAVMAGYAERGECHEAVSCYERMRNEGICTNGASFVCMLTACGNAGAMLRKGKQMHVEIVSMDTKKKKDMVVGNALVNMYAKCGRMEDAEEVLSELPVGRSTASSWNAVISAHAQQQGQAHEAVKCFERMQREGVRPDAITLASVLKACGRSGKIDKGDEIHEEITKRGLLLLGSKDVVLGNALVDMYAKCGRLAKAKQVLDELPVRDVISWNGLMTGYVQQGRCHDALSCFLNMKNEGLSPDPVSFICILNACRSTGATDMGKLIHGEIIVLNDGIIHLEKNVMLGTALIGMYAKGGILGIQRAEEVLRNLPHQDVVLWNTLIAAYAEQFQGPGALTCFRRMQRAGFPPDHFTFHCVLTACGHSGHVQEAEAVFRSMTSEHGISPQSEHHICMVRVLGRAGHFDKAMSVAKAMPNLDNPAVWLAVLDSCRKWGNVELGRMAFDQVVKTDVSCAGAYVVMANIFAAAGMRRDAEIMRAKLAFIAGGID